MLLVIENILSKNEVEQFRAHLDKADWQDGIKTAGSLSVRVKHNLQLDHESELAKTLGNHILSRLGRHPVFISATLPERIYPPKFNCYTDGGNYGNHVDAALMYMPETGNTLRSDISATLFLSEPNEYEGGELVISGQFGEQSIKLSAGDMVVYPSASLHHVTPVTKGRRIASFFWVQSMVRSNDQREILFELDQGIQSLTQSNGPDNKDVIKLSGVYHNLIRQWAET